MGTQDKLPVTILRVPDLERETVSRFRQAAEQMRQPGLVVVDLSAVARHSSMALGVLIGVLARLRDRGGDVRVVVAPGTLRRVWRATGLVRVWRIYETSDAALRGDISTTTPGAPGQAV